MALRDLYAEALRPDFAYAKIRAWYAVADTSMPLRSITFINRSASTVEALLAAAFRSLQ